MAQRFGRDRGTFVEQDQRAGHLCAVDLQRGRLAVRAFVHDPRDRAACGDEQVGYPSELDHAGVDGARGLGHREDDVPGGDVQHFDVCAPRIDSVCAARVGDHRAGKRDVFHGGPAQGSTTGSGDRDSATGAAQAGIDAVGGTLGLP
jgi:hypothetical protein